MESPQILGLITIHDETGRVVKFGALPRYQNAVDQVKLTALNNPGWKVLSEDEKAVVVLSPTKYTVIASLLEASGISLTELDELWPKDEPEPEN